MENTELKPKVLFDEGAAKFVIEALGYKVRDDGYVVDGTTGYMALDYDGNPFKADSFIGVIGDKWITNQLQIVDIVFKMGKKQ